jgi:two-component system sensor histidine kinase BaeS
MMRGQPLALRLAVLLAAILVVVLLVAGVVVNRAVSRSLDETISQRDQQRLALAVAVVEGGMERGMGGHGLRGLLERVAFETGGTVRLLDEDGDVVVDAGRPPGGAAETLTTELTGGGSLEVVIPDAQAPFLRAFNLALLVTGAVAVGALLVAAALVARRVTRPLHAVAEAARRLGAGDLAARAHGGPDAESSQLADAFNEMATRLERSEVLRRRAASDLAHDLATPATVLESQLQAMVDGVVPADGAEIEKARAAAAGLSGVIVQLGELTQAEAAPLQRRVEAVDLRQLAGEIVTSLDGMLRERGVEARVVGEPVVVRADRGQLARALRNVVANAVQHSPRDGEVRIETTASPGPSLRIRDEGPGIAAEDLPFVFERFYRADRSRGGMPGGSGIGLTVARELVAANGGTIEVEATGPDGTAFRIEMPRD